MKGKPPFDMSQAVFWLVAFVIGVSMVSAMGGAIVCAVATYNQDVTICTKLNIRDFVGELLAVALVLLNTKPPQPKE